MKLNKTNYLKLLALSFILFISTGFLKSDNDIYLEINKAIEIYGKVYKEVTLNYVDPIDPHEFMLAGIRGMLQSLDPYTNFIDEYQQKDIDMITTGKYGGIGATIGLRDDKITIVDLIEGYSAQRQGLRIGDIITKINDEPVSKENYQDISELLKGDVGTTVSITVQREGVPNELNFNLVREEVEVKNLTYYGFVPENSNNAYLKLSGFTRTAGDEVRKALIDLKSKKEIKSLILDLRGNPGGLLDAAIDVAEKFLRKGQLVVSVKGRDSLSERRFYSNQEPILPNAKMVVLVDDGTASASEIVAGALQDHDRAVILGIPSFGKGLVQTIVPLSYNTSLKITNGKYFTPSGRSIQKIDYTAGNKVILVKDNSLQEKFFTDNNRYVFSHGGIVPDTIVQSISEAKPIQKLLAEGMFFKFATMYYNKSPELDLKKISSEKLFNDFMNYLSEQKFKYTSQQADLISNLKKLAMQDNYPSEIIEQINSLQNLIQQYDNNELKNYKNDIIAECKEELAGRINGRIGRIIESLNYDKQFDAALSLLKNEQRYNTLLSVK
ncbi:S41 family peptidase [Melioribacteraceae bacterium 4301-Me]|uniref:S41 family peptidase n=1 Tax=Pyranulibacter aquaticus TaxID=3163344 RepID=UPI00359A5F62